jgi:hypothetical protein
MASQGPNGSGTAANDTGIGSASWGATVTGVLADDGTPASITTIVSPGQATNYIKATNFGFSIPDGATIDGIVVEWEKLLDSSSSNALIDHAVRIVKGGTIGSTDMSSGAAWPTSYTFVGHGSSSDLWGETWSAADINSSGFGAALSVRENNGNDLIAAKVDYVRITVHYTEAAGGQVTTHRLLAGPGDPFWTLSP